MKRIAILAFAGALACAVVLAGCSSTGSTQNGSSSASGTWECTPLDEVNLDATAQKTFKAAATDAETKGYTPVAVLATQVVAGTNYAYLCETEDKTWHIVAVYEDLSGSASVISDEAIDIANVKTVSDSSDEQLSGAWTVVMPEGPSTISEESWLAFDESNTNADGDDSLVPIATLGKQSGDTTTYRYLCAGQDKGQDAKLYLVDVTTERNVMNFDLLGYINQ